MTIEVTRGWLAARAAARTERGVGPAFKNLGGTQRYTT